MMKDENNAFYSTYDNPDPNYQKYLIKNNLKYKILKVKDEYYIVDPVSNPLSYIFYSYTGLMKNKGYQISIEELNQINLMKSRDAKSSSVFIVMPIAGVLNSMISPVVENGLDTPKVFNVIVILIMVIISIVGFASWGKKKTRQMNQVLNLDEREYKYIKVKGQSLFRLITHHFFCLIVYLISSFFIILIIIISYDIMSPLFLLALPLFLSIFFFARYAYIIPKNFKVIVEETKNK